MIDLPLNYARVLYDMNIDPENLNKARSLLTESPELMEALVNPLIRKSEKRNVIEKIFPESLWSFVKVMSDNDDTACAPQMFEAYDSIVRERENTIEAVFTYVTKPEGQNRGGLGESEGGTPTAGRPFDHRGLCSLGRRTSL